MSLFDRTSGLAVRLSLLSTALLVFAGLSGSAAAQTAPQLLPYTARLIAGGGTVAYSETSTTPPTYGPACSTGKTSSGNTPADQYGDGCLATEIELTAPRYAIADKNGNIFFSDYTNGLIRRVDATTGIVTVVAGGATASPASGAACGANASTDYFGDGCLGTAVKLGKPEGLAFDATGDLYFADPYDYNVREIAATNGLITTTGVISLVAGDNGGASEVSGYASGVNAATASYLDSPYGLSFDSAGNLYIAEEYKDAVLVVNTNTSATTPDVVTGISIPPGEIVKIVGASTAGGAVCPNSPLTTNGCNYGAYTAGSPANDSETDAPYAVGVDPSGNVYFADEYENSVGKVSAGATAGAGGVLTNYAGLYQLKDDSSKVPNTTRGLSTSGTVPIGTDYGLTGDPFGNIYFTDALNGFIWRVDGTTQTQFVVAGGGAATTAGSACAMNSPFIATDKYGDGCPASLASFGSSGTEYASTGIFGITTDANANVYVGDNGTNLVREVSSGTQFGNIGATQTDYLDVHFAAGDAPPASGGFTITSGANIFTVGSYTCTANADNNPGIGNTTDCIVPITAVPTATGPFTGTLTVVSNLDPMGTTFPLSGDFVQSPVTRTVVSTAGSASCTGSIYAQTTPVTLTAAITANGPSAPTGTITFYSNGNSLGSPVAVTNIGTTGAPIYGATLVNTFSNTGSYAITATYTPTTGSYFSGSTSAASTITSAAPTFAASLVSYQESTVSPGQTALYSINLNLTAYTGTINFACSGLPAGASCSFTPVNITASGCTVPNTAALSILTQPETTVQPSGFGASGSGPWQMLSVLGGIGLALLIGLRRRRVPMRYGQLWMALALLLAASGTIACGKGVGTVLQPGTPAGNYTITVTATGSAGTVATVTVPLTVN